MKTNELREMYLSFFESKGCVRRPSDVLVPRWDPSVLFTPAGMNQFKDHFLGRCPLEFTRATTCQKCLRTGDIDNVGRTAYHHTFFEMLGNFSFGDYFKREAIHWAWEFLTDRKWLSLPAETLSVTVYKDDDEAYNIWHDEVGLSPDVIERKDEDENFWPASAPSEGPDGVCGPCSEIYYHTKFGEVEIWNLVFTQYNRHGNPPDNLFPLPSKNIDTGMGLERAASALQGVVTNYHIDILLPIVHAAAELVSRKYDPANEDGRRLRRITDHVRACTFAIHENVYPGANKEEYVVKRLLRRAVLDGWRMGMKEPFLWKLVPAVVEQMQAQYPELNETVDRVEQVIQGEESNFMNTVESGLARIQHVFEHMEKENRTEIKGDEAAEMYTTYGFPPELFETLGAEKNLKFDWDGYRKAMVRHGEESGAGRRVELFKTGPIEALKKAVHTTEFLGYEKEEVEDGIVLGIITDNQAVSHLVQIHPEEPAKVILVLNKTPFYGEMGGQTGDTGYITSEGKMAADLEGGVTDTGVPFQFEVVDTLNDSGLILHVGYLRCGEIRMGQVCKLVINTQRRHAIARAHSATHLLHSVLRKHLGHHAQQRGSKVGEDILRFDFNNPQSVPTDILQKIGYEVNQRILEAAEVSQQVMPITDARKSGAMMLFGEKYPDDVRVITMGDSRELCGGTHVSNIAKIGMFKIISEESISAGTRRITAYTGFRALENAASREFVVQELSSRLRCTAEDLVDRVEVMQKEVKQLKKDLAEAKRLQGPSTEELGKLAEDMPDGKILTAEIPGVTVDTLRELSDLLLRSVPRLALMLACRSEDNKVTLVAAVSRDLIPLGYDAVKWIRSVAGMIKGGGGGRPEFAQAGGKDASRLEETLEMAKKTCKS